MVDTAPAPLHEADAVRWAAPVVAVATAISAALVLWELGEASFWHDEAFSVGVVDRPFGDALWRMAHWEVNQSPFLLVLAGWWRSGESEWFLRLLPAAAAVATVPAVFHLGRRLVDSRVGAVAAGLLAIHPQLLEWGQQLRGYTLVMLLVVIATTLLLRAVERPDERNRAVMYAIVAAVATYSHFHAGLVVAVHGAWLLVRRPLPRELVVAAGTTYAVLVAPLLVFLTTRQGDPLQWVGDTGLRDAVVDAAKELTGGSPASVLVYAAAGLAGLWALVRRATVPGGRTVLLAAWLVLPPTAVILSTATVKPLLEGRFLIVVLPALVLVTAAGLVSLPKVPAAGLAAALVVVSAVGVTRWLDRDVGEDWRKATALAAAEAGRDGSVVIEPWTGVFAVRYYQDRLDLAPLDVVRPGVFDPPAGEPLVEIRSLGPTGARAALDEGYVAWRDVNYEPRSQRWAGAILVQIYGRR